MCIAETDDDFRHTEKKRLGPEFKQFALVLEHISVVADFGGSF